MLTIKELSFFYENKQVLYDLDIALHKNTITGLIGQNGAGKSTLMRCVAGLCQPNVGQVLLDGQPILHNLQDSFAKIGYLPDFFGLSDGLTVLEHLTYSAHAKGLPKDSVAQAVEQSAKLLNLTDKLLTKVGELSRGQRQRVGIGQVIIHRPKLLILDEPASGLDPKARHELSQLFLTLKEAGMTLLVSSHILSELDEYCTHVLLLEDGRIKQHVKLDEQETTWVVEFVTWQDDFAWQIACIDGVQSLVTDDTHHRVSIKIADNKKSTQAKVLQALVAQNLPVCAASVAGHSAKDVLFNV